MDIWRHTEVKVLEPPVFQLPSALDLDLLGFVECVPKLGDNEEILALDDALLDSAGNTLAGLHLQRQISTEPALYYPPRCYSRQHRQAYGSQL